MRAALPANEERRLQTLYRLDVLDTPREQNFDDIAQLAMSICETPIAVVSLVDRDRQWFKSCIGLDGTETSRDIAFCAHAILTPTELCIVADTMHDPRFADNPLVAGDPHIRFYAGAPLVTRQGDALGTLCVVDYRPRQLTSLQINTLKLLANQVMQLLELREANIALQQERANAEDIIKAASLGTWRWNLQTGETIFNERWADMLGYNLAELAPVSVATWLALCHPEDIPIANGLLEQHLRGELDHYECDCRMKHKQGDWVHMYVRGRVISFTPDGKPLWISGTQGDITERKRIEQMKNEFVSAVSHELRTPLTSISGSLGVVVGGMLGELPGNIKNMLSIAHKNALRLTLLINDLLDMEKLLAGKMVFDMRTQLLLPIVEQSLEGNAAYADTFGIRLALQANIGDVCVHLDTQRLQQVLANFISNAVKFSPPGGQVELQVTREGMQVKIAVVDHGPGISDEFRARIFQKFSQADASDSRQRGGTGLGLAISKAFVERMQGTIGFASEAGKGATFFAVFPVYAGEENTIDQVNKK